MGISFDVKVGEIYKVIDSQVKLKVLFVTSKSVVFVALPNGGITIENEFLLPISRFCLYATKVIEGN